MSLPWAPLLTVERTGLPEFTLYGSLAMVSGNKPLLAVGDVAFPIWTRSLLKPWHLAMMLPTLSKAYPDLAPRHLAMMMASINGEPHHLSIAEELMSMGGLSRNDLQCPSGYPMNAAENQRLQSSGAPPSSLYNPCCGKHLGHLLYVKALGESLDRYLSTDQPIYQEIQTHLEIILQETLPQTHPGFDGCGMPNLALTPHQIARLYQALASNPEYSPLQKAMRQHPEVLGGIGRLDTRLIEGARHSSTHLYAKEGADGLLAIGIAPCQPYPEGVGIFLKLASGHNTEYREQLIQAFLAQLGFIQQGPADLKVPLRRHLHFEIPTPTQVPTV